MGTQTLSEAESAQLVARYGVPFVAFRRTTVPDDAVVAADELGYPVAVKLDGAGIAHKTERGLVRLGLTGPDAVCTAAADLLASTSPGDGDVGLIVARMVRGTRELTAGLHTDPQFGRCVMVGIGGVLAEAIGDVVFRLAPLSPADAADMLDEIANQDLLGPFRGELVVDRAAMADILLALSRLAGDQPDVVAVDINPIVVADGTPIAVDALVETV